MPETPKKELRTVNGPKIAAVGVAAGLLVASIGLLTNNAPADPVEPDPLLSATALDSIGGRAPIGQVVSFFAVRADAQPLDYIHRTQLGVALSAQARETADLAGYADAEDVLREALDRNPGYQPAKLSLASALHSQHEFAAARNIANEVIAADSSSLAALALVGDSNLELGDYAAAAQAYDSLSQSERSAPVISRLVRLATAQGDHEAALNLAHEALDASTKLPLRANDAAFYWFQLGHTQFDVGDTAGAVASLNEARLIDPSHAGAAEFLAFVLTATGDDQGAAELYEYLLDTGPAADLHGSYADLQRRLGNDELADQHEQLGAALAAETIDEFPAERRHLVGFFLDRDPDTAIELAQKDFGERQDIGAFDTLAWALHSAGRDAEAVTYIDQALAMGDSAEMLYHGAVIAHATGDRVLALERVTAALALNPSFHPTDAAAAAQLLNELS